MLIVVIAACEVGFWVLLLAGLSARYLLHRRRVSTALLLAVPFVDLVLLVASVLDLARGATATAAHGLAAAYIGFSVAFGPATIRWADARFAHRFAGGPTPPRPPKYGAERARREWRDFLRALRGWAVSCTLLLAAILLVHDGSRTGELLSWIVRLSAVLGIWFVVALSYTLWPKAAPADPDRSSAPAG